MICAFTIELFFKVEFIVFRKWLHLLSLIILKLLKLFRRIGCLVINPILDLFHFLSTRLNIGCRSLRITPMFYPSLNYGLIKEIKALIYRLTLVR